LLIVSFPGVAFADDEANANTALAHTAAIAALGAALSESNSSPNGWMANTMSASRWAIGFFAAQAAGA